MQVATEGRLIQAMQRPGFYSHPVKHVELIETHISWLLLAGDFAYKVKKPVNFGFLDFSTLAKRHHFCLEELRLNRRFAPQLYLEVKVIGGNPAQPEMGGTPPLEYAVQMKRFAAEAQLNRMLAADQLSSWQMERFASMLARVHHSAAVARAEQPYGTPKSIIQPIRENFAQIRTLPEAAQCSQLDEVQKWSNSVYHRRYNLLQERKTKGFVRECHGDVHLANMAWVDGEPLLFDCIEFNENLRWIDVINDIAFLVMDLCDRNQAALGCIVLNRYLQESGDYEGLQLLRFYEVYRAMVRAKVACLRLTQPGLTPLERQQDREFYQSYLKLCSNLTQPQGRGLIITHGLSGSGKTTLVRQLSSLCGAIHLQSDVERKRLFALAATADSHSPPGGGIYSARGSAATYARLESLSATVLSSGYPVIVDATFLQRVEREQMRCLAATLKVPLLILDFALAEAELRRRIVRRSKTGGGPSEANTEVLNYQLAEQQPLDAEEQQSKISVGPDTSAQQLAARIFAQLQQQGSVVSH